MVINVELKMKHIYYEFDRHAITQELRRITS